MTPYTLSLPVLHCRCGHAWVPRPETDMDLRLAGDTIEVTIIICPVCGSRKWDQARKERKP
jgi:hypothetical protein